ncbi:hypothetical protein [Aquimarina rubra]|uniref:Uncharacterized protein n=1 Tax=Aquimarina rubra TaxID=1920033 RepID=A0ABW5LN60_9FLAO
MEEQYKDIQKLVKEAGVENPSTDFLQSVMDEVASVSMDKSPVYQPLISKKAWVLISLSVIVLLVSLPFLSEGTSILDTLDLSIFSLDAIKNPFSGFKFHKTTTYGIIFLAILCLLQITVIKRRIDKTYAA